MFNPEDLAYHEPVKKRRLPKVGRPSKKTGLLLAVIATIALLGGGTYFSLEYFKETPDQDTLGVIEENKAPKEVIDLVQTVKTKKPGLPENEMPSVATVSDLSKLSNQPFFEGATIGDKVLIYAIARQAVLYRPSTGKIIRQSPVEVENDPYAPQKTASDSADASSSAETVLKIKF